MNLEQFKTQLNRENKKDANRRSLATALVIGLIIFMFVIIGIAVSGSSSTTKPSSSGNNSSSTKTSSSASNREDVVNSNIDGQFKFEVEALSCYENIELEDSYTIYPGSFCLMELKVGNVGSQERSFSGDNVKLLDSIGREFAYFDELLDGDFKYVVGESINPGFYQVFKLSFKVPPQTKVVGGKFHDSFLSDGVELKWKAIEWKVGE